MAQQDPANEIARLYMQRKGYPNVEPVSVAREGYEWIFDYVLNDGRVELIVSWDAEDGWDAYVAGFDPD